jgi:DNA-binding LacI/PurR family transcriptional regulator
MTTVSLVVDKTHLSSDALRQRSLTAMIQPDYRPHALAHNLHHKGTHTAGLIPPDRASRFSVQTILNRGVPLAVTGSNLPDVQADAMPCDDESGGRAALVESKEVMRAELLRVRHNYSS